MTSSIASRAPALFGGAPLFSSPRFVGRPNIGDREKFLERVNAALDDRWLTNAGPHCKNFEAEIARVTGAKNVIAVTNGTIALELVVRAMDLQGEVIVPSYTFVATAHAAAWHGLRPVFVEIDEATHCIDPVAVEAAITPETSAIIAVHLWGRPAAVDELEAIARRHNVRLILDAAHAFGSSRNGKMVGTFGDAEVFSFHATKFVNSLEGGAITTDDDALAARIRLMLNFGFAGYDDVVELGTNGKMNEVAAAMGITSIESMDQFINVNRTNFERYKDALLGVAGLKLLDFDDGCDVNYQYVVVEVDEEAAGLSRDELVTLAGAENAKVRRYFWPGIHRFPPYRKSHPDLSLPITERLADRVMVLPTGTAMNTEDIDMLCGFFASCVDRAAELREKMSTMTV